MSLSDEHSLESAKDQGLSPESNEISSAAIEKQLVTGKTRVLWNFVHGRKQMPLSDENDTDKDSRMKPILPSTQGQESMCPSIHVDQSIQKPLPLSVTLPDPFTEIESVYETEPISLTFDDYKQQRKQWIHFLWLELKQAYIDDLYALLSKPPYDYSETIAEKFAEDLLDRDWEGSISRNPPTGSECDGTDLTEHRKGFQRTVVEQLLLLRFPLNEVSNDQTHILSLDEDDKSREQQNRGFVTMYRGSPRVCHKRIDNRDELFYCIRSYLHEDCNSTCLATIVINGHGSKRGLRVNSDDNDIPLTDIIDSVQDSMDAIRTRVGSIQFPRAVDIIFAQCYGHMHGYTENPRELINVVSLTSSQRPITIISGTQSFHYDLKSYGERRKMLQQQALQSTFTVQVAAPQEDITTSLQGATGGQESNTTVQAASQEDTTTSLHRATGNNSSDSIPEVYEQFVKFQSSRHLSEEIPTSHDEELPRPSRLLLRVLKSHEPFTSTDQPGESLPNAALALVQMRSETSLSDEHDLKSVQDKALSPESNEISSATIDKQLVTKKTTVVWLLEQRMETKSLSDENDTKSGQHDDNSELASAKPLSEVAPPIPEQKQKSLSSIGQGIPEPLPHSEKLPGPIIEILSGYEAKRLTFDEFKEWRKQWIEFLLLEQIQEYIDELYAILSRPPYDFSEAIAREFAKDLLDPDSNISTNPPTGSEHHGSDLFKYREGWLRTVEEQLLMLRFPLQGVSDDNNGKLSLDQDDKSRKQQNEEFVTMYEGSPRVCHKRIDNKNELFDCISSYLQETCSSTCLATIVFNGHGSKSGLRVHPDDNVPLREIIGSVQESMSAIRGRDIVMQKPYAVDIVFAQCFGHLYQCPDNPVINVISFTSEKRLVTWQNITPGQSKHYDLLSLADKRKKLQQKAQASNSTVQAAASQKDATTSLQGATGGQESNSTVPGAVTQEDATTSLQGATGGQESNSTVQAAVSQEDATTSLQGATGGQESNSTVQAAVTQEDATTSPQDATGGQESNSTVPATVSQEDTTTSLQGATGGQESNSTVPAEVTQEDTTTSLQGATGGQESNSTVPAEVTQEDATTSLQGATGGQESNTTVQAAVSQEDATTSPQDATGGQESNSTVPATVSQEDTTSSLQGATGGQESNSTVPAEVTQEDATTSLQDATGGQTSNSTVPTKVTQEDATTSIQGATGGQESNSTVPATVSQEDTTSSLQGATGGQESNSTVPTEVTQEDATTSLQDATVGQESNSTVQAEVTQEDATTSLQGATSGQESISTVPAEVTQEDATTSLQGATGGQKSNSTVPTKVTQEDATTSIQGATGGQESNSTVPAEVTQEDTTTSLQGATGGQESNSTVPAEVTQEDTTTSLQGATGGQENNSTVPAEVTQEDATTSLQGATGGQESNTTVQAAVTQEDVTTSLQDATGGQESNSTVPTKVTQEDATTSLQGATGGQESNSTVPTKVTQEDATTRIQGATGGQESNSTVPATVSQEDTTSSLQGATGGQESNSTVPAEVTQEDATTSLQDATVSQESNSTVQAEVTQEDATTSLQGATSGQESISTVPAEVTQEDATTSLQGATGSQESNSTVPAEVTQEDATTSLQGATGGQKSNSTVPTKVTQEDATTSIQGATGGQESNSTVPAEVTQENATTDLLGATGGYP